MAEVNQQQVIEYIKGISVMELSQLVKALETELGVSAAAAMPMMGMPMAGGGDTEFGLEGLDELRQLHHGNALDVFDHLFLIHFGHCYRSLKET